MAYPDNSAVGQVFPRGYIDAGPSFGLVRRPLFNEREITALGTSTLEPYDHLILLNGAGAQTFQLLDVAAWARQPWGLLPLLIKDKNLSAAAFAKIILPFGTQTIDGLPQHRITTNGGFVYLRPYSDLSGWMTAA